MQAEEFANFISMIFPTAVPHCSAAESDSPSEEVRMSSTKDHVTFAACLGRKLSALSKHH